MFVTAQYYRMRAFIEGDNYLIKVLVNQARTKIFKELINYLVGYSLLTGFVVAMGFYVMKLEQSDDLRALIMFVYVLEGCKFILDQVILIMFFRLLRWQRDTFKDLQLKEEYYNFGSNERTLTSLTRLTTASLIILTFSY